MPIKRDSRVLNVDFDLSYMDSPTPVGKYDPDVDGITWTLSDDCVRCICGCTEDGGSMIQCDKCYFWLHMDCHDSIDQNRVFLFIIPGKARNFRKKLSCVGDLSALHPEFSLN